jgi:hypothetical protein
MRLREETREHNRSTGKPTVGCVSVSEAAMIFFLSFIDRETRINVFWSIEKVTATLNE